MNETDLAGVRARWDDVRGRGFADALEARLRACVVSWEARSQISDDHDVRPHMAQELGQTPGVVASGREEEDGWHTLVGLDAEARVIVPSPSRPGRSSPGR